MVDDPDEPAGLLGDQRVLLVCGLGDARPHPADDGRVRFAYVEVAMGAAQGPPTAQGRTTRGLDDQGGRGATMWARRALGICCRTSAHERGRHRRAELHGSLTHGAVDRAGDR